MAGEKSFQVRHGLVVSNTVLVSNNNRIGINTSTPNTSLHVAANDAIIVPVGSSTDRPFGLVGMFRYNTTTTKFEGFTATGWGEIAGAGGGYYKGNQGAVGNTNNRGNLFRINSNTLTQSITFESGENAQCAGPIVVQTGINMVINPGARVVIS